MPLSIVSAMKQTIPPDYHSHTSLCKHAEGRAIDYAQSALQRGITQMCCTEHAPAPEPFSPGVRMDLDEFPIYLEWVQEANEVEGIEVLLGIEADYYENCESFLRSWLPSHPFDYVLGSVHFLGYHRDRDHALTGIWDYGDTVSYWSEYFRRIALLADTGLYDVVAHLDLPKKFNPPPALEVIETLAIPALDRIAKADMGIEINTSGIIHEAGEPYPSLPILRWAKERHIPLSFGSDSHHPERMGADFDRAVALASEAGYTQRAEYRQRKRTMVPLTAASD